SIKISYSPNKSERESISKLINNLDSSIALLQRKLEKMKNIKEFLLNKMFVSGQVEFPEIRFKYFKDKWNKSKISNIAIIKTGNKDANAMVSFGKYNFYTSGVKVFKINTYNFEGESVTIAGNGANLGHIKFANGLFDAYQRTYVLKTIDLETKFLFYFLKSNFKKYIKRKENGGGIPFIVYDDIANFFIKITNPQETNKIVNTFSIIDNLIEQTKIKLLKIQNIKNVLINKMFV
ncbi:restriction endonuclease subunit S, partial [Mycoplasma sp. CSL7491-lung]|uniref:restriction endonuclease subunit S n=1 Tax=Mycoplasma sp. CSL7491-lung TaxID=549718 RepID=UPI001C1022D7